MKIKPIKVLIISVICICNFSFAVNDEQKLVIAAVGSSVTAGVVGYSQYEVNNSVNDGIFESFKKKINSLSNYLFSKHSIANILTDRANNHVDKLRIINSFDAFNDSNNTYYYFKIPNVLAWNLYKLINDPVFYLILQMSYASTNNADVVIGIDMFFWIIYSKATDEQEAEISKVNEHKKIKTLKKFLNLLNNCNPKVNFIIGNIPQVSFISLGNNYSPDPAIIDHANDILQDWVTCRNSSDKAKAILIDITKTYKIAKTDNKPFRLHKDMPAYTRSEILSIDDLHLSVKGENILVTYLIKILKDSSIEIFQKLGVMLDN